MPLRCDRLGQVELQRLQRTPAALPLRPGARFSPGLRGHVSEAALDYLTGPVAHPQSYSHVWVSSSSIPPCASLNWRLAR